MSSSLGEIQGHLHEAHEATEAALNYAKAIGDQHLSRAHVKIGAAMQAGLESAEIHEIAGALTEADAKVTELAELLSATMSRISDLGSL